MLRLAMAALLLSFALWGFGRSGEHTQANIDIWPAQGQPWRA